jgi:hypothetical protein
VSTVPDKGEQGAVLKLSDGAGEVMLESGSREVSEINMEGLSATTSREADLCSLNCVSRAMHSWSTGYSADAVRPR